MELKDYQRQLFPYAYNILGSYDDAKDAIQDVISKYYLTDKADIDNENNYLIKSVINQSINIKKRNSKSTGSKISLPEPVFSTESADGNIVSKEIISYSLLVLLDALNAKERAVFILKEAFDYSHEDIGSTLHISVENSRKLLSRARTKLGQRKLNITNTSFSKWQQLESYIYAVQTGNVKSLETMLVKDIAVMTDGGTVSIVADLVEGSAEVIQLMTYVYANYQTTARIEIASINHQPALLFYQNELLSNCQVFDFEEESGLIKSIYSIVDPEKLKKINKF